MQFNTIEDLQTEIERLETEFGLLKINLVHDGEGNEGIWAVPIDKTSEERLRSESSEKDVFVRLVNAPLRWGNKDVGFPMWGCLVKAVTKGEFRAEARVGEQTDQALRDDKAALIPIIEAAIKSSEKKPKSKSKRSKK